MKDGSVFRPIPLLKTGLLPVVRSIVQSIMLPVALPIVLGVLWISPLQALEDPTRPPTADAKTSYVTPKKNKRSRWTLHSTLVSSSRRTAVINNRVVSLGDRINGATVVSIQPSSVRLRAKGREVTLVMLKKNIKTLSRVISSRQGN